MNISIIFFLFLLQNGLYSFKILSDSETRIINFISRFVSHYFESRCDYVFVNYADKPKTDFSTHLLQSLIEKSSYQFNLKNTSSRSNNEIGHIVNITSFKNIHRFAEICSLIFVEIFSIKFVSSYILFEILTKRFGPITMKDEDFYITFTKLHLIKDILSMKFYQKLKFKIVLPIEFEGYSIKVYNSKFFPQIGKSIVALSTRYNLPDVPEISQLFPDLVRNFQGGFLRISLHTRAVYCQQFDYKNDQIFVKRGYSTQMFLELQKYFNFTYRFFVSTGGGGSGMKLPNNTWTGTVSDIFYERAELAFVTGAVPERYPILAFSYPVLFTRFIFTVGLPKKAYSNYTIFYPFSSLTWLALFISLVFCYLIFILINKYHGFGEIDKVDQNLKFYETFGFILGSIFEQGTSLSTISHSNEIRILISLYLFYLIIINTLYRGKFFELLIFPPLSSPPLTYEGLLQTPGYTFGLENSGVGTAIEAFFKTSNHPTYAKIYKDMKYEKNSLNCFLKGLSEPWACIAYHIQSEYLFYKNLSTKSGKVPFQISKEATGNPHPSGFIWEKRSVFGKLFDSIVIGPLYDAGFVEKWRTIYYNQVRLERSEWQKSSGSRPLFTDDYFYSGPRKIEMKQLEGIFNIYLIATSLSILCVLGECLIYKIIIQSPTSIKGNSDSDNANTHTETENGYGKNLGVYNYTYN